MALSLQLLQKQTQRLIMTPQMQQSIQLLQLNTVELEQLTQNELLENPFLQLEEDRGDAGIESSEAIASENGAELKTETVKDEEGDKTGEDILAPVEAEIDRMDAAPAAPPGEPAATLNGAEAPATDQPPTLEEKPEHFKEVDVNWEEFFEGAENRTYIAEPAEERPDFSEYTAARQSLYEHLLWQLRLSTLEGQAYEIGEYLLGCLDENGYLTPESPAEAACKFNVEQSEVERILEIIQEFEPTGIGARTSAECLLIQMIALGSYTETARTVLENHFEALQRKKFKEIARKIGVDEKEILDLYHKVGRLEPKPGRAYTKEPVQYIKPDVHVKLIDGEMSIYLNESSSGHLSVNRLYRRLIRLQAHALTKEEKDYTVEKFRNALMLIKNIEKRKSTILRVTEAIMEVQRKFLDKGVEALRPLTLREVADMVGMHESTIARVTSRKYVETPQGVFALKYFFSSSIESTTPGGAAVSSRSIKDKLIGLIDGEDPKKPLSDQKIAEALNRDGFNIARRTVAKYREQLKILPAKLRREA